MAIRQAHSGDNVFFDARQVGNFDDLVPRLNSVASQAQVLTNRARAEGRRDEILEQAIDTREKFFELDRRFNQLEVFICPVSSDLFLATTGHARTALVAAQLAIAKMVQTIGVEHLTAAEEGIAAARRAADEELAEMLGVTVKSIRQARETPGAEPASAAKEEIDPAQRAADEELAEMLGVTVERIQQARTAPPATP